MTTQTLFRLCSIRIISKRKLVYRNEVFCFKNNEELYNRTDRQEHPSSGRPSRGPRLMFVRGIPICRSVSLRRKHSDNFQSIDVDLLNHSINPHRCHLAHVEDHRRKVPLRLLASQQMKLGCHCSHSLTAKPSTENFSVFPSYKVRTSRYKPISRVYNLFWFFHLALFISGELTQFHFQCRRRIFVDKVKLKFRFEHRSRSTHLQATGQLPRPFQVKQTSQ